MSRGFYITRASIDSEDPTALSFWPPKGSDELHEALKEAYPFESNLAARMRQAVIEFLLQEQHAEQCVSISPVTYLPSPQSTFVSSMPSPATSSTPVRPEMTQSRSSTEKSTQQELMDVWALPNKPDAKIHTRRVMTSDEKKAYKQKRLIGACADCKRRRRKCDHGQQSGSVSPPRKAGKHKKRMSPPEAPQVVAAAPQFSHDLSVNFEHSAFNVDLDMPTTVMSSGFDMQTAFDLETSPFDFPADLNLDADWPLFPNFQTSDALFNDPFPTWSRAQNMMLDDRAVMAPDRTFAGGLQDLAVPHANDHYSPVTPISLSPMSRSQSNGGQRQHASEALPHGFLLDQSFFVGDDNMLSGFSPSHSSSAATLSPQGVPGGIEPQSSNDLSTIARDHTSGLRLHGGEYSALDSSSTSCSIATPGARLPSRHVLQLSGDQQAKALLDGIDSPRSSGSSNHSGEQSQPPRATASGDGQGCTLRLLGDQALQRASTTAALQQQPSLAASTASALSLSLQSHATLPTLQASHVGFEEALLSSGLTQSGDGQSQQGGGSDQDHWSVGYASMAVLFIATQWMLSKSSSNVSMTTSFALATLVVSSFITLVCAIKYASSSVSSAAWSGVDSMHTAVAVLSIAAVAVSKIGGFSMPSSSSTKLASQSSPSTPATAPPPRSRPSLRSVLQALQCRVWMRSGRNSKVTSRRIM